MICENCKTRDANIHITQAVQGYKKEINLCTECLTEKGLYSPLAYLSAYLGDILKELITQDKSRATDYFMTACTECGMPYDRFLDKGLLGCARCYDSFSLEMKKILNRFHGTAQHVTLSRERRKPVSPIGTKTLEMLKAELKTAVESENFERAAELRDKIKKINSVKESKEN